MVLPLRNTRTHYGLVSQALHWAVVVLVVVQFVWAWRMDELSRGLALYEVTVQHKSFGMTILGLMVLRVLWRLFNRPPPLPAHVTGWEHAAARFTHWLLYGLLFAMPLSGWIMSSAADYGAEWFGWVNVPDLVGPNEDLQDVMEETHEILSWVLLGVIGLHVLAALRHHFLLRDRVLKGMLPTWQRND